MNNDWKTDVVEYAQEQMNNNSSMTHKGLVSHLCNEVIGLRAEVERLEKLLNPGRRYVMPTSLFVKFDEEGRILESKIEVK